MITRTEAELSLIGALLVSPELLPYASGEVSPNEFYDERAGQLYRHILELAQEDRQIDAVTLIQRAGEDSKELIMRCVELVPVASVKSVQAYAGLVREEAKRRTAGERTAAIYEMLEEHEPLEKIQAQAEELAQGLVETGTDDETTIFDGLTRMYERLEEKREYIKTGFSSLDRCLYIDRGDYIILGGRPSAGKTAFSLALAQRMAQRLNVVYFSLETNPDKITERLIASYANVHFGRLKKRELTEAELEQMAEYTPKASKLRLTIVTAAGRTAAWIQAKALKLKADVIFIDYIGLIDSAGRSRYEKMTETSIALHTMAQRTGIVVFGLSQLRRCDGKAPTMEDLRESGQIEQDADAILLLHNDQQTRRYAVLVEKNKEGETGLLEFKFFGETQSFYEVDRR